MITKNNFKDLLLSIGFKADGNVLQKHYDNIDASLVADFDNKKLIYPENEGGLIVNSSDTCNFRANENFVVFECVHQLFEKGYKPKHLELEPKWQVGHGVSGGRADILIKNNSGKSLLIIECKTAGREFEKAWKNTLNHPTQIFTYAQQVRSTDYICLYASDFDEGMATREYKLITLKDNEILLEELKDKNPFSYRDADSVEEIWQAWEETYDQDYFTHGILEEEIEPYKIGKEKFTANDLKPINHKDIQGKYHEFATILRQHNVSGRENAFDKLVNLFLCKIVDESQNPKDLKFYWKGIAYDSAFELQDRLQKLYQIGMKELLGEDVTYIDNQAIDDAFRYFKNDPDATKDTIKQYFRDLKFFTNNDFAFIDVHNERLFRKNAEVLLKIVLMLEDIKLKTDEQNQFLGDMFEGFLDQGVKQSEGQFFTPMPIVKFILKSLPLEQIIQGEEEIPKVIDYACGAGHFLNEYAKQLKPLVEKHEERDISEYYPEVVGIEKEYRLSKVAKVSSFMYGQDDIKIIYADALAKLQGVKDNSFSILISNPPYSVKGYLETLSEEERKQYSLIKAIDKKSYATNNSIETFFLERAKNLLKPGGAAGIIVPASVLSKGSSKSTTDTINVYVAARELLLKYFDILGIVELGSTTFGKTGTTTVTLFLRRRKNEPAPAKHYKNRVNNWFAGNTDKDGIFEDQHFIKKYCQQVDYGFEEYKFFLNGRISKELKGSEVFKEYRVDFKNWKDIKNRKEQVSFKNLTKEQQRLEIENRYLNYTQAIEKEKLYFFIMAALNNKEVVIVRSPSSTSASKKFLGYEWSHAKGKEGIKYLGAQSAPDLDDEAIEKDDERVLSNIMNLNSINTPLYDPDSLHNTQKINYYIASNFEDGEDSENIPENLEEYVTTARLEDMINFTRVDFDKSFDLSPSRSIQFDTKWELKKLGDISEILKGNAITENETRNGNIPVVAGGMDSAYFHDKSNRDTNIITVSASGANAGFVNYWDQEIFASDCSTIKADTIRDTEYIFNVLKSIQKEIFLLAKGAAQPHVYPDDLKLVKIPFPNKEIRKKIVEACKSVDEKFKKAQDIIKESDQTIEKLVRSIYNNGYSQKKLSEIANINPRKSQVRDLDEDLMVSFIEMASVSEDGYIVNKVDKKLGEVYSGSYTYFAENDIFIAKITPCMENGKCAIATGLTNNIGFGSSEFNVIRVDKEETSKEFVFAMLNREFVRNEAETKMTGSSGHRRVPVSFYKDYSIPLPSREIQKDLVEQIGDLRDKIAEAQSYINKVEKNKQEAIQRYL